MDLRQIAEVLAVPLTYLTGAKGKPKLRLVKPTKKPEPEKPA